MNKPLIFLGLSPQIIELMGVCERNSIDVAGIIDSDYFGNTESFEGIPIIGSEDTADFTELKNHYDFFISLLPMPNFPRNIDKRLNYIKIINEFNLPCANIIDPDCRIDRRVTLGKGIYIGYTVHIGYNTTVGDHCQIHFNSGVGHNSAIGQNCILQRGVTVGSHCTIGENAYIGFGARLVKLNNISIGANSFIHPGITVLRDVEENETVKLASRKTYMSAITDNE